ncbi:unnamed protein product [Cylindrotheca closterium]|uniref:Subtilisin n=1 Tax=Cylindrotheca closterium TaxID=2856 RepID=A0AAD2JN18_9STRA|nr:unnamed protein product [Cylindrotheca closterium]CAJ1965515.1 unnamed protein product [Cylindrotheca closterium]
MTCFRLTLSYFLLVVFLVVEPTNALANQHHYHSSRREDLPPALTNTGSSSGDANDGGYSAAKPFYSPMALFGIYSSGKSNQHNDNDPQRHPSPSAFANADGSCSSGNADGDGHSSVTGSNYSPMALFGVYSSGESALFGGAHGSCDMTTAMSSTNHEESSQAAAPAAPESPVIFLPNHLLKDDNRDHSV